MAESVEPQMEIDENNSPSKGIDITPEKDGGVLKEIKREGNGDETPSAGDTVFVHYVGTLLDGETFDSSRDRGDKFSFKLGKAQVISGWDIGVATMKRGELCELVCRSDYAYGDKGTPPSIGPKATLVFEVELFDWKGEDVSEGKDEGVLRSTIESGEGFSSPTDGAEVKVHIVGTHDGKEFENRDDLTFVLGEGSEVNVVPGVEMALKKFTKGEKSKLKVKATYAFGVEGNKEKGIPADTDIEYEVTLKSFEKSKEGWEMDLPEKLEQAEIFKTKGTNFFKGGKYQLAMRNYNKVADLLEKEEEEEEKAKEKIDSLLLAAHLNLAMCYLKLNMSLEARDACDAALEIKPKSDKAHFRKGQAELNMQNNENAIKSFKEVLEIDPKNKAAKNQITIATQKIKEEKAQEKKLYAGMFQKFADKDSKQEESKPSVKEDETGDAAKEEATEATETQATNGEPETVS